MSTHGVSPNARCNLPSGRGRCRCAESPRGVGLALAAAVILLGGCGPDAGKGVPAVPEVEYRRFVAVQVTSHADSASAQLLRDSLEASGWVAYVRSENGRAPWHVRVAPTQNMAWAEVTAAGLGDGAEVIQDSGTVVSQGIAGFTRISYQSPGMITRVRWARSPDLTAILVIEDATAIENDPAPNGFVFASETALNSVQMDSVWDAAPAPDWDRVAFGRAYVLRGGRGAPPPGAWSALADTIGVTTEALRSGAFPASGMSIMFGAAQPGVVRLAPQADSAIEAAADASPVRLYPVVAGWRVAWNPDGSELLAGLPPEVVRDDSPAAEWVSLDPIRGDEAHPIANPSAAAVDWVQGPTLDVSVVLDTVSRIVIPLPDADTLTSQAGWIRLGSKIVGPGVALTATRNGRYVVALAPNPSAEEFEPTFMAVMYLLGEEPRGVGSYQLSAIGHQSSSGDD